MAEITESQEHHKADGSRDTYEDSSLFGVKLLREHLLPELLGEDIPMIQYWAGRKLAQKFPCETEAALQDFFIKAGFGFVKVKDEKRHTLIYSLQSPLIDKRKSKSLMTLEAGFIAEFTQMTKSCTADAHITGISGDELLIEVKWDRHDEL